MSELTKEQQCDPQLIKVVEIVSVLSGRDPRKPWGLADIRSIREMPPVKETEANYPELFEKWEVKKHQFIPHTLRVLAVLKNSTKQYVMFLSPVSAEIYENQISHIEDLLNSKE